MNGLTVDADSAFSLHFIATFLKFNCQATLHTSNKVSTLIDDAN
jgi:hypothetical protein